jgi:hypothetical protein
MNKNEANSNKRKYDIVAVIYDKVYLSTEYNKSELAYAQMKTVDFIQVNLITLLKGNCKYKNSKKLLYSHLK